MVLTGGPDIVCYWDLNLFVDSRGHSLSPFICIISVWVNVLTSTVFLYLVIRALGLIVRFVHD